MLSFRRVFDTLALLALKIQTRTKIEIKENTEYYNIRLSCLELAYSGVSYEDFEDFLRLFLFYENSNSQKLFDVNCLIKKEVKEELQEDFLDHKYKFYIEKSVSILLQEWFYNLKSIFYNTKEQNLFFEFLNKAIYNKTLPLIYSNGKYQINDNLFNETQQEELDLFYLLFINRNQNTIRLIKDNSMKYNDLAGEGEILKIKAFEAGSKEMIKSKNKAGGKNRLDKKKRDNDGKRIKNPLGRLDLTKKDDEIFQANYLKEHLFKQMYLNYLFRPNKLSRRARSEHIFNILVLLKEIKENFSEEGVKKFIQKKINETNGFPSILIEIIKEETKDKKMIYSRISKLIARYFKINIELLQDSVNYISDDIDKQSNQFKTFYEKWSREFDIEVKED